MSTPLYKIHPSVGSYNLNNSLTNVDFPAPLLPTIEMESPFHILKLIFSSAYSSLLGYLKETFLNSNSTSPL